MCENPLSHTLFRPDSLTHTHRHKKRKGLKPTEGKTTSLSLTTHIQSGKGKKVEYRQKINIKTDCVAAYLMHRH